MPSREDYQHIREKIIDYLSRQGFSEKKLLRKVTNLKRRYPHTLRYRFYTLEHVQKVINELKAEGLVDDRQYAEAVLRQLRDRKDGMYRIRQKMQHRLIPRPIIEKVLGEWKQSGAQQDYTAIVQEAKRKYGRLKEKYPSSQEQYTVKQKLYAFLAQKGYTADEVKEIMGKVVR